MDQVNDLPALLVIASYAVDEERRMQKAKHATKVLASSDCSQSLPTMPTIVLLCSVSSVNNVLQAED